MKCDFFERGALFETGIPSAPGLIIESVAAYPTIGECRRNVRPAPRIIMSTCGNRALAQSRARKPLEFRKQVCLFVGVDQCSQHGRLVVGGRYEADGSLLRDHRYRDGHRPPRIAS